MVIGVIRVDIEGFGQLAVAFQSETLIITFELLTVWTFRLKACGKAFDLLLSSLAVAREKGLRLTWPGVVTSERGVALVEVLMSAAFAGLTTRLVTVGTGDSSVLAVAAVTRKIAVMRPVS